MGCRMDKTDGREGSRGKKVYTHEGLDRGFDLWILGALENLSDKKGSSSPCPSEAQRNDVHGSNCRPFPEPLWNESLPHRV